MPRGHERPESCNCKKPGSPARDTMEQSSVGRLLGDAADPLRLTQVLPTFDRGDLPAQLHRREAQPLGLPRGQCPAAQPHHRRLHACGPSSPGIRGDLAGSGSPFRQPPDSHGGVAGVVGRADVLACLFLLLTFITYCRYVSVREGCVVLMGGRWLQMGGVMLLTTCSMLAKEQAVSVLAVCAVYDIVVVSRAPVVDVITMQLFVKSRYNRLREGLLCLLVCGCSLVGFRVYFMGNKPPEFAPSDNPASDSDSLLTRTLTFNYLPAANAMLLLFPCTLSFDWSMEAIPLLTSFSDPGTWLP
ncbi:hypothetical protein C0Q70_11471 [Pomacea canaliculata]|uniref:DUF1736 domain-containing protein n=1 Tax=Pomacea canaliculata TaxID=400727 RepID=A0A2T7P665_POMCA|nr:hypothetical protein C0Q70_11471 [Pomacea canaliculata]